MTDIVVGIDGSEASERALDRALLEAERTGRLVRAVHVWNARPRINVGAGLGSTATTPAPADSRRYAQELLDDAITKALHRRASDASVEVKTEVHEGEAGRVLCELSAGAAQLVVGGSGHGHLAIALLGSESGYVLHHAQCPVMVVPKGIPVSRFSRIVVGIDGSPSSRAAFDWGMSVARPLDCPIIALHAWNPSATTKPPTAPPNVLPPGGNDEQDAHDWLDDELAQCLEPDEDTTVVRQVTPGPTVRSLLDEAGPGDLLVLGSRGHSGFTSLLVGSVAAQCTTHARGTVVVVHA